MPSMLRQFVYSTVQPMHDHSVRWRVPTRAPESAAG